jgi:hypothetical protein
MLILKHPAFLGTAVTYFSAHTAMLAHELAVHRHHGNRHLAHHGAFHQHTDAILPDIHISFAQTRAKAFAASLYAFRTGVNTGLIPCHRTG